MTSSFPGGCDRACCTNCVHGNALPNTPAVPDAGAAVAVTSTTAGAVDTEATESTGLAHKSSTGRSGPHGPAGTEPARPWQVLLWRPQRSSHSWSQCWPQAHTPSRSCWCLPRGQHVGSDSESRASQPVVETGIGTIAGPLTQPGRVKATQ